jgi:hypothetical protein
VMTEIDYLFQRDSLFLDLVGRHVVHLMYYRPKTTAMVVSSTKEYFGRTSSFLSCQIISSRRARVFKYGHASSGRLLARKAGEVPTVN